MYGVGPCARGTWRTWAARGRWTRFIHLKPSPLNPIQPYYYYYYNSSSSSSSSSPSYYYSTTLQ